MNPNMLEDLKTESNPLYLDVVLNHIFPYLPLEDLLSSRLTCKTWCGNSKLKKVLDEKSAVSFKSIYLHTSTQAEDIDNLFQICGPIYSRYYFENFSYRLPITRNLFTVLGPTMHSLKLHLNHEQLNINQFREIIYEKAVNLEELNIYALSHDTVFRKKIFPELSAKELRPQLSKLRRLEFQEIRFPVVDFMTEFMETLPALQEITVKADVCSDWDAQSGIMRRNSAITTSVVEGLRYSGGFKFLKVLRMGMALPRHVDTLLELGEQGLQLEILELHSLSKDSSETFTKFLNTQSNSLKQLIMFEKRGSLDRRKGAAKINQVFVLRLPTRMEHLELIQLSNTFKSCMVPMHPPTYSKQCPNLRKLIFLGHDGYGLVQDYFSVSPTVTEVVLNDRVMDSSLPSMMALSFSNLTRLNIRQPSPEFVAALWTSCVKIRHLTMLLGNGPMDAALSALPQKFIDSWSWSRWFRKSHVHAEGKLRNRIAQQVSQSILNLKGLKVLKLIVEHEDNEETQVVGDVTGYFVISRMTYLCHLELLSSHWLLGLKCCFFLSEACQRLIREELKDTVIRFEPNQTKDGNLNYDDKNLAEFQERH